MPFAKLRAFDVEFPERKKLLNDFAFFDFESICVRDTSLIDTKTTTCVGKYEPISVSVSSNLPQESIFIRDFEPQSLVSTFVTTLENISEKK